MADDMIHVVKALTTFTESKAIAGIHYLMFHGRASRGGMPYPAAATAFLNNDVRTPLDVIRSKDIVPDFYRPAGNLIVSQQVADQLRALPHLELLPVRFERLVELFYEKGDFSFYRKHDAESRFDYFLSLPDVPEAHAQVGTHYELIIAKNAAIKDQYEGPRDREFSLGPTIYDDTEHCSLSPQMVRDYPVMRLESAVLFDDKAFNIVSPYIDRDYFLVETYPVEREEE